MDFQPLHYALSETLKGLLDKLPTEDDQMGELSFPHLRWMCDTAMSNVAIWPVDKTSRWVGYIQGVMVVRGVLDVAEERDRTRPLFHKAYSQMNQNIPDTLQRNS